MSLLAAIRARTAPLHQELESVLNIQAQVQTVSHYVALLARFNALYRPWEARLDSFASEFSSRGIELSERHRVPNLERDLASLDASVRLPGGEAYAPPLSSFPEAMGSLYVLEGSTLGGQVLTRHFRESLSLSDGALHFFSSHGPLVGKRWKEFCAALEAYGLEQPSAQERAVQGAADSFSALLRWFRDRPVA